MVGKRPILQALVLVALVNALLLFVNPFKHVDPDSIPSAKSWVWWTRQDYIKQEKAPDIVLLGSSLLMNPVWMNEATYRNKTVDIVKERDVRYLDALLRASIPGATGATFNFALPGAMVSDDYMILRTVLNEKTPKVAVFGLSPMDIIDSDFWCPAASAHYKYLKRFTPTNDLVEMLMPQPWQRIQYYANELQYLTARKHDVQVVIGETLKKAAGDALAVVAADPLADKKPKDTTQAIYQSDIQEGVWLAHPIAIPDRFQDNSADFKKRYLSSIRNFDNRRAWLKKCLDYCKSKEIVPLVLNMPLAQEGIDRFPPGLYEKTVAAMRDETVANGCLFVDLQATGKFDKLDFTDVCHMDGSGGRKLLNLIARQIADNEQLRHALSPKPASKLAQTKEPNL